VEEEEQEESDDELCDRTTAPVPKWEVLAGNRAVWVQLCQQLRLDQGSGEFGLEGTERGLQCSAGGLLRGTRQL
jgi:hypothetical protein